MKIYCHLQNSSIFYGEPPGNPASLYQNLVMNLYCIVKSNLLNRSKQFKRSDFIEPALVYPYVLHDNKLTVSFVYSKEK